MFNADVLQCFPIDRYIQGAVEVGVDPKSGDRPGPASELSEKLKINLKGVFF